MKSLKPALAAEWHPTRNEDLLPDNITVNSNIRAWWICHKGHEWEAEVAKRSGGNNCPYCSGKKVCNDNSLATLNPEISKEWHFIKNGNLTPDKVTEHSNRKVWWKCKKEHEWEAKVSDRTRGNGCPYCSGRKVSKDNSLKTLKPALAAEWHSIMNGDLTPNDVTPGSNEKAWWICSKGHEWEAVIYSRSSGKGCPYCAGRKVSKDNSLIALNPKLAAEWHPTKNSITSYDVTPGSNEKAWWICEKGHEWEAKINNRNNGKNCPYCAGKKAS